MACQFQLNLQICQLGFRDGGCDGGAWSALIDFPIAFGVESHLEQAVLRIMALAAAGTGHVAAPSRALAIVVLGYGEGGAATAGDQEHAEGAFGGCLQRVLCLGRSLTMPEKRLRSG